MKTLLVVAGILVREGRLLLGQRPLSGPRGGLWELPGGKVEPDEPPACALAREWREELGVRVAGLEPYGFSEGEEAGRHLTLLCFSIRALSGEPHAIHASGLRWCSPQEARLLPMPPLDIPVVERLLAEGLRDTLADPPIAAALLRRAAEEEPYVEGSEDLAPPAVLPFVKRGLLGADRLEGILVASASGVFAYENLCPHVPVALDRGEGEFLSIDGAYLACRSHGALFVPETGVCVSGPCKGESLRALPVEPARRGWSLRTARGSGGSPTERGRS